LPKHQDLVKIYRHYAQQLSDEEIEQLARKSDGFSPYDVLDVCDRAEELFIAEGSKTAIPELEYYLNGLEKKRSLNLQNYTILSCLGSFMGICFWCLPQILCHFP